MGRALNSPFVVPPKRRGVRVRRRINHRQLEAFRTVMEAGSVTAAAERLLVTQPAVSRLIQDLESAIGVSLFERLRGRLSPTVEAQVLYEEVQRSFIGLDKILRTAEDIRTFGAGTLRIAAMPAMALGFLPEVIGRFSDQHRNVNVSLQIRSSTKVMEWIASQQTSEVIVPETVLEVVRDTDLMPEAPPVSVAVDSTKSSNEQ